MSYLLTDVGLEKPTGLGRDWGRGRGAGAVLVSLILTGQPSIVLPPAAWFHPGKHRQIPAPLGAN